MNIKLVRIAALVASVGFAACGDSTDLVMDELSEAEARELASALMMATFNSAGAMGQQPALAPGGPQLAPIDYSYEFEGSVDCALGGSVAVSATLDVVGDTESEEGMISYTMTQVHDECRVKGESEREFTLWGAPAMVLDFTVSNDGQGVIDWEGSVAGGIRWATDDRMGTCEVALAFSGHQEGDAGLAADVAGTVCGFEVLEELTVG